MVGEADEISGTPKQGWKMGGAEYLYLLTGMGESRRRKGGELKPTDGVAVKSEKG